MLQRIFVKKIIKHILYSATFSEDRDVLR